MVQIHLGPPVLQLSVQFYCWVAGILVGQLALDGSLLCSFALVGHGSGRVVEHWIMQLLRGRSSVGRASALHAEGRRFDSGRLHQFFCCGWLLPALLLQVLL